MTISIRLTRSSQQPHDVGNLQGYFFTVTAHDAVGMPNEIFRMYQKPLDPIAGTRTSQFNGIATPTELTSLPINAPVPPNYYYYRVASFDVVYENVPFGDLTWETIKKDTQALVDSLIAGQVLAIGETVVIHG